jgi:type II secretory pathway component GspD/PulD (secretin)
MCEIGAGVTKQRLLIVVLAAAFTASAGCAAGRAFRKGEEASRAGNWDAAVTYFQEAVQGNPDSPEYKIALERAMQTSAQKHISTAYQLEQKDQLDAALLEYRKAIEMDSTNRLAVARAAELERIIRDRIEATRPKPRIDSLREQARQGPPPLLGLRERLRNLNFNNSSVRDILSIIGTSAGIRITYDQAYQDKAYSIELEDVTVEEALQQIMSANQLFYKVVNSKTIIVVNDRADKRQQYDDMVVRVFYVSHADAQELSQMVTTVMRVPQMPVAPVIMPNKTANTITVRATTQVADIIERIIRSNDKPRAEVVIDVQILEVNRQRVKQYGLNLNAYALGFMFSPEVAPPNTSAPPTAAPPSPPPFNVNTISQGISAADFYMTVPTALVRFLETDARTKTIAKPQLRGAEGTKLTLNLGDDVPVLQTVFGAAAQGGFATIPQSSYTYRSVGVNVEVTPRVTYEGEIIMELVVENSTVSGSIDVGGQSAPTFGTRKVTTRLRMREGESNLLAGLLREDDRRSLSGFPGLLRLPVFKQFLSNNDQQITQTDIVMLLTPHIVRTHELTAADLSPIYIGTQQNLGLGGPPPLIAPPPDEPVPSVGQGVTQVIPTTPGVSPGGVPRSPVASDPGAQPVNRPPAPGTSPVPTPIAPVPEKPVPPAAPPAGAAPATPPAGAPTVPPGGIPPVTTPPAGAPAGAAPTAPATAAPPPVVPETPRDKPATPPTPAGPAPATPSQVILTVPGTTFQVAGGPYTMPVSINNASRVSVMTLTITFNPKVLRVRNVQDGTFMRQGGVATTFTPQIDVASGRVDIAITRTGDQVGASGSGLLAALLFDAVGPGSAVVTASGVASTPEGAAVPLQFSPVTVTVR